MASGKDLTWIRKQERLEFDEENEVMEDFRDLMWRMGESKYRHYRNADDDEEELFTALQYAYGSIDLTTFDGTDPSGEEGVWEPIGKCFFTRGEGITWPPTESVMKDAYRTPSPSILEFFPHAFTEEDSRAVFGELECGRVFGPSNALVVTEDIHKYFSRHQMVFEPTANMPLEGRTEYVLRVLPTLQLNLRCCKQEEAATGKACDYHAFYHRLNGIQLDFRTNFKPAKQYVFYHYLIGLMKFVRDWQEKDEKLDEGEKQQFVVHLEDQWPTEKDNLIKRSTLEHIILRMSIDYEKIADVVEPRVIQVASCRAPKR